MAKPIHTFTAGDDILAEEINENFEEVWQGVGIYGESAEGSNDYAISADVDAYYEGMVVSFKADFTNTGACTLNVNSLGAKEIKIKTLQKGFYDFALQYLAPGDIQAGQIISVVYDGTDFQYLNFKKTTYNSGTDSRDASTTGDQTIAHGLGFMPKKLNIVATLSGGEYNTTIGSSLQVNDTNSGGSPSRFFKNRCIILSSGVPSGNYCVFLGDGSDIVTATAEFDATNITITWAKTGSPTGTINFLWEVEG